MFILINENNSLTYYTSALEFEVESYLNKKDNLHGKSLPFYGLNGKTTISKFWLKLTDAVAVNNVIYTQAFMLKILFLDKNVVYQNGVMINSVPLKKAYIHTYSFEIVPLSLICENLQKSLDYFDIKKNIYLFFYNLTR